MDPCMELSFSVSSLTAGAIDLAAKSAGIIPVGPLPILDADSLSGIAPLPSNEMTVAISSQDSGRTHPDGERGSAVAVSAVSVVNLLPVAPDFWGQGVRATGPDLV